MNSFSHCKTFHIRVLTLTEHICSVQLLIDMGLTKKFLDMESNMVVPEVRKAVAMDYKEEPKGPTKLLLSHFYTPLIFLACGNLICIVVLICELVANKY